jgi:hypothetical protein
VVAAAGPPPTVVEPGLPGSNLALRGCLRGPRPSGPKPYRNGGGVTADEDGATMLDPATRSSRLGLRGCAISRYAPAAFFQISRRGSVALHSGTCNPGSTRHAPYRNRAACAPLCASCLARYFADGRRLVVSISGLRNWLSLFLLTEADSTYTKNSFRLLLRVAGRILQS